MSERTSRRAEQRDRRHWAVRVQPICPIENKLLPLHLLDGEGEQKIHDAQAGYESAGTMWPPLYAGTNFVLQAAGWLEGGLIAGYEKFILDLEIYGIMAKMADGIKLDEEEFAFATMN
ncbi:MAG: trimethylamine methyltransferase family protein [Caldilineaceae bacterium]|nr:trimethylamine methyltransferase family protein [Caldilineaceae bacterium]